MISKPFKSKKTKEKGLIYGCAYGLDDTSLSKQFSLYMHWKIQQKAEFSDIQVKPSQKVVSLLCPVW